MLVSAGALCLNMRLREQRKQIKIKGRTANFQRTQPKVEGTKIIPSIFPFWSLPRAFQGLMGTEIPPVLCSLGHIWSRKFKFTAEQGQNLVLTARSLIKLQPNVQTHKRTFILYLCFCLVAVRRKTTKPTKQLTGYKPVSR